MKTQQRSVPSAELPRHIALPKNIAAIQIQHAEDGRSQLGVIAELPESAELDVCGEGFNARTVKVRWAGQYYFVFMQDIEQPEMYGWAG